MSHSEADFYREAGEIFADKLDATTASVLNTGTDEGIVDYMRENFTPSDYNYD